MDPLDIAVDAVTVDGTGKIMSNALRLIRLDGKENITGL